MIALLGATIEPWMLAAAAAVLLAGMLLLFLGTRRRSRAEDVDTVVEGTPVSDDAPRPRTAEATTGSPAPTDVQREV